MAEIEGTVPSSWYIEMKAERDRLRECGNGVAAIAAELARWSNVAAENGDLHARLASAFALWEEAGSSAAGQPVGERQGRQPASSHNPRASDCSTRRASSRMADLTPAERENLWWRSIIGDAIYALRHQDDLTREDIAGALVRSLEEGPGLLPVTSGPESLVKRCDEECWQSGDCTGACDRESGPGEDRG